MKSVLTTLLLLCFSSVLATTIKSLKINNKLDEDIQIKFVTAQQFVDQPGSPIGIAKALETTHFTSKTNKSFRIDIGKGENLTIIGLKGTVEVVLGYYPFPQTSHLAEIYINEQSFNKGGDRIVKSFLDVETQLSALGQDDLTDAKQKIKIGEALHTSLGQFFGSLVLFNPKDLNSTNELDLKDAYIIPGYVLGTVPKQVQFEGTTLTDEWEFETNLSAKSSFSFPLAANINLGYEQNKFYKSTLELKKFGWISPQLEKQPVDQFRKMDKSAMFIHALNILNKFKNCPECVVYETRSILGYEELLIVNSRFDKVQSAANVGVSSVVTANGAYNRSESTDKVFSVPATIVYVGLNNDVTAAIKTYSLSIVTNGYNNPKEYNLSEDPDVIKSIKKDYFSQLGNGQSSLKSIDDVLTSKEDVTKVIDVTKTTNIDLPDFNELSDPDFTPIANKDFEDAFNHMQDEYEQDWR